LIEEIELYIQEKIIEAEEIIAEYGVKKIKEGDIIMTYSKSNVIREIFYRAKEKNINFKVIVVDSKPLNEGKEFLKELSEKEINCTFISINAISNVMKRVTKIFLGSYSMLSNGVLISRSGTAIISIVARYYHKPVLVFCQTTKFSDKSLLDSMTRNEVSDVNSIVSDEFLKNNNLNVVSLLFDVTPLENIDMVVTEYGMVPPTAVPVILREYVSKEKDKN
jgi:translation initiation factor eIF-2B subunit delta